MLSMASLKENGRVLELGTGTGQLTKQIAPYGHNILGIEIGENLTGVARENLSTYNDVLVINDDFTTYDFRGMKSDLTVAATCYNWLPKGSLSKIEDLLEYGVILAIISTYHVNGGNSDFFRDSQRC